VAKLKANAAKCAAGHSVLQLSQNRVTERVMSALHLRQRIYSRYELASLSEGDLRDIGVTRGEAEFEAAKSVLAQVIEI
jgi:uncharacterized protein YjiS (DUF1127 family)